MGPGHALAVLFFHSYQLIVDYFSAGLLNGSRARPVLLDDLAGF